MSRRYPNPRLVKIHRSYSVRELADRLGKHPNTIRNWLKDGLESFQDGRQALIHGQAVRRYLEEKRSSGKFKCPPGTLGCFRCKQPRRPAFDEVELSYDSIGRRTLTALCSVCLCTMKQRVSSERLRMFRQIVTVTIQLAQPTLSESSSPSDDCD